MRMKKIRLLFLTLVALVGGLSASATKTIYVDPVGNSTWMADKPAISLYVFGDGDGWATSENLSDGVIKFTFDDKYTKMIIVRSDVANSWDGTYKNQTPDIADIQLNKLYKANGYNGNDLAYTVEDYTEPVPDTSYKVDFNTAIETGSHDFAVASNWKHIVGSNNYDNWGPYYMSYSYGSTAGVDGTGALNVGAQNGYWMGNTQSQANFTDGNFDYLVTPLVNGTVTLQVKRYNVTGFDSYVKIFKVNEAGTTVGAEVETEITPAISESDWSTLTLTLAEETRLAIRAQAVTIDNFTAESATIVAVPGMTITSVKRADSESTTYFDMNADGTYTVKYLVKVTNSGETALVANTTENYTLSVSINGTLYGTFNVPVNLAIGETSEEFEVSIVMPSTAPTGWKTRYLAENLTGTTYTANEYQWAYSNTIAYNPVPFFIKQGNEPNSKGATLSGVTSLDFGMISSETTENYEIFAHNAGDLQIKSITAPEGFSVAPAETLPFTITAHSGMNVDVTATATATATGNMVITYVDKNGNDATQEIALSQTVIDASKWIATFDDSQWPANTVHQSSLSISSAYYGYSVTSSYNYSNKFITPLLAATAGEKFTFDARLSSSTGTVKVYVTNDRSTLGDAVLSLSNSQLNSSTFTAQELTIEEPGNYYIVFEIYQAYIDNLYGLEKVDVDHDIMVNAYKIGYYAEDKEIQTGTEQDFKLEITPVQAEAAANYTVKLYANDEVVATADGVDLTAGTDKTLTVKWTPSVTANTTFVTYAAIEFTDGTKISSSTLNLKVTCEPIFVFFDAGTTVGSSQPSNRSKAITFGKTNELNQVQNFEIYNFGKADLTVKSITVPEGFTVSVASATVAPATRQPVDITFSATVPNTYEGQLEIVYVDKDGVDQTFPLSISGTLLDPTKWYANFDNTTDAIMWPTGSVYEKNLQNTYRGSYSDNNFYIYQSTSYTTDTKFITPKLEATAGETFSFDVAPYASYSDGTVKVYLSTDRVNWGDAIETIAVEYSQGTNNYVTKSVAIPTAGQYYVAIEPYNAKVDEICGLTLIPVAHDWQITSSNVPAEGMQNVTYSASVNILNLGLADEAADSYTVTAYVDDEAVATGEAVAIPMSHKLTDAGTQLSVSFVYPKVGTFPVYLEVKAGDYSVNTESVDVEFVGEVAIAEGIQVGTQSGTGNGYGFVDWYNNDGSNTRYTDILYTAAKISAAGIKAGDKIAAISFKASNSAKTFKAVVTSWVGMSTGDITYGSPVKGEMAEVSVYNGTIEFPANVESVINLATPIEWDGISDIRVYTEAEGQGSGNWMFASYAYDNDITMSYNGTTKAAPLAYFTLVSEPATLAGIVKNTDDQGVAGATITLKAENGVEYSGTTGNDGSYSFNVIQAGLDFTATVEAEGYLTHQFAYNVDGNPLNETLYRQFGLVGTLPGFDWDNDKVMIQSTEDPSIFTLEIKDVVVEAGTYAFKLRADGKWNTYQLPAGSGDYTDPNNNYDVVDGNYSWNFNTSGTYNFLFTFDWNSHKLTFERPYILSEEAEGVADLNWVDVTVAREFKAGWNAVVLPFDLSAAEVTEAFGENSELAVYDGDEGSEIVTVKFKKIEGEYKYITAGYPYMLWLEAPVSGLKFTKNISSTLTTASGSKFDFVGVYATTPVNKGDYFIKGGEFVKATTNNKVLPFRAYLKLKGTEARSINFVIGDQTTTEIDGLEIEGQKNVEGVYNLNGQKVQNMNRKGLYIINGKKVMVK